jgi:hypothetical protein
MSQQERSTRLELSGARPVNASSNDSGQGEATEKV